MVVLKKAVAVTKLDTYIGAAYRSVSRTRSYGCSCTCY